MSRAGCAVGMGAWRSLSLRPRRSASGVLSALLREYPPLVPFVLL